MKKIAILALLAAICLTVSTASAETDLGLKGIGARIGYVMPEDPIDATFGLGLQVKLGTFMPNLSFEAFAEYWGKSYDSGVAGYESSFSDIGIGALVKYYFELQSTVKPYVGGGLGFQFGSAKTDTPFGEVSGSDTELGVHLLGGAELPLSPSLDGVAEIKYVASDLNYFGIFAGVIYNLGAK